MLSSEPRLSEIGPSRHRSAQIKADNVCRRFYGTRGLTEILSPTCNATAQPSRSRPHHFESFLPLAKSYRMTGMPKANLRCRSHRGSIAVRIVMARRREEGIKLTSCSYLGKLISRFLLANWVLKFVLFYSSLLRLEGKRKVVSETRAPP
jgi:hypothetical protein